jgi:hypothetical protein
MQDAAATVTPLPVVGVLDTDGWAICPDCLTRINCGPSGLANLDKRHRQTPTCDNNKAKRAKEELKNQKAKKNRSLLNYFTKPKAASIPSKVNNTAPVHSHKLALEVAIHTGLQPECEELAFPSKAVVFNGFLARFQFLIKNLPESIPEASDYDKLAIFGARPCDFDDTSISSGDLWEEVVNKVLKSTFGWGMEGNMDEIIRRGKKGLDGLAEFVKYFVVKRGVDEALFEGKLSYLMRALEEK